MCKIHGNVQGVGYRFRTKEFADTLGIFGWVKNDYDGTVSLYAQGEEENLHKLLDFCYNGNRYAEVEKIDIEWIDPQGNFKEFSIE